MDILIILVIATFIIAGGYVGYHYSQDPGNFEAHGITIDTKNFFVIDDRIISGASVDTVQYLLH